MSIDEQLEEFWSVDIDCVIEDSDRFRRKLDIGPEAFKWLTNIENLSSFAKAVLSGTGISSIIYAFWFSSLGTMGKIALTVGILSNPVGWLTAAGVGSAATIYLAGRVYRSFKKDAVTEIPNFINTPLDVLGSAIADLLCPILLKIAHADEDYSDAERQVIEKYFIEEWGFNRRYILELLDAHEARVDLLTWDGLGEILQTIAKTGDLKFDSMTSEIVRIANEVIISDGIIHPNEVEEVLRMKNSLKSKGSFASVKQWLGKAD